MLPVFVFQSVYSYHYMSSLYFTDSKKMVNWFRGYLVVVSKDVKQLPRASVPR